MINSSCNGIRLIGPATRLIIHDCLFYGPGQQPHRTSGEKRRTNMLSGIILQPGAWDATRGPLDDVLRRLWGEYAAKGIGFLAYSPVGGGRLNRKLPTHPAALEVGRRHGISPHAATGCASPTAARRVPWKTSSVSRSPTTVVG